MTVKEMIKYLSRLDPDAKVFIREHSKEINGNEFKYRVRIPFPAMQRVKEGKVAQRACEATKDSEKCLTL